MSDHQHTYTATVLDRDSVRAAEWLIVHRSLTVRIESPIPEPMWAGGDEVVWVVRMDVTVLSAGERERLIQHVARKFGLAEADVASDIAGEHGCPLRLEGLLVEGCCGNLQWRPPALPEVRR